MFESARLFWESNSSNILISLGVGFVFFVLGPMGVWFSGKKIKKERINKAKDTLVDLLESMVVNDEDCTLEKLSILFQAVEREVNFSLSGAYCISDLIYDVVYRIEKSKHLGAASKKKYYDVLLSLKNSVQGEGGKIESSRHVNMHSAVIDELEIALRNADIEKSKEVFETLKQCDFETRSVQDPISGLLGVYRKLYKKNPRSFWVIILISVAFYAVILKFMFESLR